MRDHELDHAAALHAVLCAVTEPVLVLDKDGRILAANAPALARLGPGAELPGVSAFAFLPETAAADLSRAICTATASGRPASLEIETSAGLLYCAAAPLDTGPGRSPAAALHLQDRTETSRLAEDLRRERQRQFFIMEALPGFAFLVDQDDTIRYANMTFRRLFGRIKGKKCRDVFPGENTACICPTPDIFHSPEPMQWEWRDAAGRTFQTYSHPMTDLDGSRVLLVMGIDITGRKQAEDDLRKAHAELERRVAERTTDLEQANVSLTAEIEERRKTEGKLEQARRRAEAATKAKSRFLANMSHEIRTPLNAVLGMAELARRTGDAAERRRFLDMLSQAGEALLAVIGDILDYSKLEARKLSLESIDFDLTDLLVTVQEINRPAARAKGLDFALTVAPDAPCCLKGDPSRLMQILNNLLANAVKFTNTGQVSLGVDTLPSPDRRRGFRPPPDPGLVWLSIVVSDSGIGIPPESQKAIFQSFEQADGAVSRRYGGTGLGLAICRELAQLMGGDMTLLSTPGQGSTFTVTLPFSPGDPEAVARREAAERGPASGPLPRLKVLLAEDAPLNRELAVALLAGMGHVTVCAGSGLEALEVLRREPVDLVLMDVQMPDMDGITATRIIRESRDLAVPPDVPVVALTAHAMKGDRQRLLKTGMDAYVSKPFKPADLERAMAEALARKTQRAGRTPAPPPASGPEPPLWDRAAALDGMDGNAKLLARLLDIFRRDAPGDVQGLRAALAAGNREEAHRLAHLLKGTAATVGALRASAAARAVENALAGAGANGLPELVDTLEQDILATFKAMTSPVAGGPAPGE